MKIWLKAEKTPDFHRILDKFVEKWIMANKKKRQRNLSLWKTRKSYPNKSFEYDIPKTKALKND